MCVNYLTKRQHDAPGRHQRRGRCAQAENIASIRGNAAASVAFGAKRTLMRALGRCGASWRGRAGGYFGSPEARESPCAAAAEGRPSDRASSAARAIRDFESGRSVRTRDHRAPGWEENRTQEAMTASLARMKAEAELASLYRERAIARAWAARRDSKKKSRRSRRLEV